MPSQARRLPPSSRTRTTSRRPEWVTLRRAEEATGVPASTIRSWAKKDRIASQLDLRDDGPRRMVDMGDVISRARQLGRLEEKRPDGHQQSGPPAPPTPQDAPPTSEDSMLVPIDAWNRMLNQLGNLHEAGQQLAEARERAAKAETEATFLRERLGELRGELADAKAAAAPPTPEDDDSPESGKTAWWARPYVSWRRRRS